MDKGHGRRERRTLTSSTAPNDYLDWPGVGQVFRRERERAAGGRTTVEVVYGITSLTRAQANAGQLLTLVRGHWGIENRLHYVRDVTLGEDACRVRKGAAPEVLAARRNAVVHLLADVGATSRPEAIGLMQIHAEVAVKLSGIPQCE